MSDRRYNTGLWIGRLITVVPPLILLICIAVYLAALKREALNALPQLVAAAGGQSLKREIRIGGIAAARSFDHITFTDVAVSDAPTFAQGGGRSAITADQVDVDLDASAMVVDPKDAGSYITQITLTRPYGYAVRLPGNKFNFSDLIPKPHETKSKPFAGKIIVRDGALRLLDRMAPASMQPAVNDLVDVNGDLDYAIPRTVTFSVVAQSAEKRFDSVEVIGNVISVATRRPGINRISGYDIHIAASQADAVYFTRYFLYKLAHTVGTVQEGRADVALALSQQNPAPGVPLDIAGTARFTGGALTFANRRILNAPVTAAVGFVNFTGNSLALTANAQVLGMPIAVNGSVPSFKKPAVALRFVAPSVDVARLHDALPFIQTLPPWLTAASRANVIATAVGPLNLMRFDVAFTDPTATVFGTPLTSLRGNLIYQGHSLAVSQFVASSPGRRDNLVANGVIGVGGGAPTALRLRGSEIDLSRVALPASISSKIGAVRGTADISVAVNTAAGAPSALPVAISARVRQGWVYGLPVDQAIADISTDGRSANVARLLVLQPDGALATASGTLPVQRSSLQPYDVNLSIEGANLADIAPRFGVAHLSGRGYFRGKVTGSAANPSAQGRANVFAAAYGPYRADEIGGMVDVGLDQISVAKGSLRRFGASASFSGSVSDIASHDPRIDADVSLHPTEIADIADVAREALQAKGKSAPTVLETAVGSVEGSGHIAGRLSSPTATLHVMVASASIAGVDIQNMGADADYAGGAVHLARLKGIVEGATLTAAGSLNLKTKAIVASADVTGADLESVATVAGITAPVTGVAAVSVEASGTLDSPNAVLTAEASDLKYRDIAVDLSKVKLNYARDVVTNDTSPIVLKSGPASYTVSNLLFNTRTKAIEVTASVAGEHVARLLQLAREVAPPTPAGERLEASLAGVPSGLDGALSVSRVDIGGTIADPTVHAVADVQHLTLGSTATPDTLNVSADFAYAKGQFSIAHLDGRGPVEYIEASGTYQPAGALNGRFEASNIPLTYFKPVLPKVAAVGGDISDITVIATGSAAKPVLNASLSLQSVSVSGVAIDRIDSGRITIADNRIDLAGVTFVKDEAVPGQPPIQHIATIQGNIPFNLSLEGGVKASFPTDQPVKVTAQVPEQSVSLISLFAPSLHSDKLTGTLDASVELGGTIANKVITGAFHIKNGTLQPEGFQTAFNDINVSAIFNGASGTISSTPIRSSKGGSLTISGTVAQQPTGSSPPSYSSAAEALLSGFRLDLKVAANGFTVSEPKLAAFYNAGVQGVVNGQVDVAGPVLTPLVSGAVTVTKAIGTLPTLPSTESATPPVPLFNPSLKLSVDIARGGQIKSSQLTASTDGVATIGGTLYRPDVVADVYLRSGQFRFPTAIFRIQPTGSVHFVYNPPEQSVERVQLTATTSIAISNTLLAANSSTLGSTSSEPYQYQPGSTYSSYPGATSQRYQITVTIDGDLSQPNGLHLEFRSNPAGLTTNQILASLGGEGLINPFLAGGNVTEAASSAFQGVLTGSVLPSLLLPIENAIGESLGLSEFDVDYDPNAPLLISVVKQLGPRMDVRYTKYVNSRTGGAVGSTLQPLQYSLTVDYYLTNRFGLYASTNDQDDYGVGLDALFNF